VDPSTVRPVSQSSTAEAKVRCSHKPSAARRKLASAAQYHGLSTSGACDLQHSRVPGLNSTTAGMHRSDRSALVTRHCTDLATASLPRLTSSAQMQADRSLEHEAS